MFKLNIVRGISVMLGCLILALPLFAAVMVAAALWFVTGYIWMSLRDPNMHFSTGLIFTAILKPMAFSVALAMAIFWIAIPLLR